MAESVEAFRLALQNPDQRAQYTECLAISVLLDLCILGADYKLSDAWVSPLRLTELGESVREGVAAANRRLKPNDIRLAVWLAFGSPDGLLASPESDLGALRRIITADVLQQRLLYPYVFGRELHDQAAKLYPGRTGLNNTQTLRLLKALPIGVFQRGRTTVGPLGCLEAPSSRQLTPSHNVPGYLCSDVACREIHSIALETGDAGICKATSAVRQYLDKNHSGAEDLFAPHIWDAQVQELGLWRAEPSENLLELISDCLSREEIDQLADRLLRRSFSEDAARQRELSKSIGRVIGNPTALVESLTIAELIQLLLLYEDQEIVNALDQAVVEGDIRIQEYETRISRLTRWGLNSGTRAELGALGVRFSSPSSNSGLLTRRLFALLHHLYFASGALEPADLAYALGVSADGQDEQELLGVAVRRLTPEVLLKELVVPARKGALAAASYLGVDGAGKLSRDQLLERLLWKLGTPQPVLFLDLERVAKHGHELEVANEAGEPEDVVRGHISNVFAAIEDALQRALTFSVWALTVDHAVSTDRFLYSPDMSNEGLIYLDERTPATESHHGLQKGGKNTLAPLAAGFSRLAKALLEEVAEPTARLREEQQVPQEARLSSKPYAFPYTLPFLNLNAQSQRATVLALQAVASQAQHETVLKVRNSTIHGNNPWPTTAEIVFAVDKIGELIDGLERHGLYPTVYTLESVTRDAMGRSDFLYRNSGGEQLLHEPGWAVAPGLPSGGAQLVMVPVARFVSSGPLRFRLQPKTGRDDYWTGYPKRWVVTSRAYDAVEKGAQDGDSSLTG